MTHGLCSLIDLHLWNPRPPPPRPPPPSSTLSAHVTTVFLLLLRQGSAQTCMQEAQALALSHKAEGRTCIWTAEPTGPAVLSRDTGVRKTGHLWTECACINPPTMCLLRGDIARSTWGLKANWTTVILQFFLLQPVTKHYSGQLVTTWLPCRCANLTLREKNTHGQILSPELHFKFAYLTKSAISIKYGERNVYEPKHLDGKWKCMLTV